MKKLLLLILLFSAFTAIRVVAQPNPGFEQWYSEFGYENPEGWQTFNILSLASPPTALTSFKASGFDVHSGNYALKMKSVEVHNGAIESMFGDTAGGVFTGSFIYSPLTVKYGFPYTARPEKFNFWAKYIPVGNDTAGGAVLLTKWNGTIRDTVGVLTFTIPPTSNYAFFENYITYREDEIPDSATMAFITSYYPETARINSTLYVDDVSLTGWVGINESKQPQNPVQVFPNPATDHLNFKIKSKSAASLSILNINGQQIETFLIENGNFSIDTQSFSEGIYFYELRDSKNVLLKTGKFNIIKE